MNTSVPQTSQAIRNRAFHCRMRNRFYEEVYYAFRGLEALTQHEGSETWLTNLETEIKRCMQSLDSCLEYAEAAVFFGKDENIKVFGKDKRWGILQEEILITYFLKELKATCLYILSRIETDKKLIEWNTSMNPVVEEGANPHGFIAEIKHSMEQPSLSVSNDFKAVYDHILARFDTGNSLFGTIQELQRYY
ncbi:MAG: hypothetical protein LBR60_01350 [Fibrobacter sp.]|jgi:hypothetical protein|nr:hypothetical protein [Fibrobacter sp.]